MIITSQDAEQRGLEQVADLMCVAARTAPKAKGVDNLETLLVSGEEKDRLSAEMRRIAVEAGMAFFDRDAGCLEKAPVVLLLGQKVKPIGVKPCGYCGHGDCAACAQNGGQCAISIGDLGIAIGSAYLVSQATLEVSHLLIPPRGVEKEVARFDAAQRMSGRTPDKFVALAHGLN